MARWTFLSAIAACCQDNAISVVKKKMIIMQNTKYETVISLSRVQHKKKTKIKKNFESLKRLNGMNIRYVVLELNSIY